MKKVTKVLFAVGFFAIGILGAALLWITKPEAVLSDEKVPPPSVEYMVVEKADTVFDIPSQGFIEPDKRSMLAAEVGGKIVDVSPQFEVGERVSSGDVLVKIDPTDYLAAVAQAESTLADAESALATEEAKAKQAMRDWKRLGNSGSPSDMLARKPQLKSAQARVKSAKAALSKATVDLERTEIKAPYDGIISKTETELGSFLSPAAPVVEIYTTAPYEVRLPLSVDQASFLETNQEGDPTGTATITASAAGQELQWKANITRSEGEVERATRSLYVVATIDNSDGSGGAGPRPGLYIDATIPSRPFHNIAKIPFRAFRDLNELVIINPDNQIEFRRVNVIHRHGDDVFVSDGVDDGERVCLTELPDLISGMMVTPSLAGQAELEPLSSTTSIAE